MACDLRSPHETDGAFSTASVKSENKEGSAGSSRARMATNDAIRRTVSPGRPDEHNSTHDKPDTDGFLRGDGLSE